MGILSKRHLCRQGAQAQLLPVACLYPTVRHRGTGASPHECSRSCRPQPCLTYSSPSQPLTAAALPAKATLPATTSPQIPVLPPLPSILPSYLTSLLQERPVKIMSSCPVSSPLLFSTTLQPGTPLAHDTFLRISHHMECSKKKTGILL